MLYEKRCLTQQLVLEYRHNFRCVVFSEAIAAPQRRKPNA